MENEDRSVQALEEAKKQVMHIVKMSPLEDEDVAQVEQCFDALLRKYSNQ